MLMLALLPWVGFGVITAAALIGETEGWGIAANVVVQSSYGLTWYFISRVPEVMKYNSSPVVVWSPAALKIMGTELALIPMLLGVTYFVQSREARFHLTRFRIHWKGNAMRYVCLFVLMLPVLFAQDGAGDLQGTLREVPRYAGGAGSVARRDQGDERRGDLRRALERCDEDAKPEGFQRRRFSR